MLYLLGYNKYKDSIEVPFSVSQKGIAEGVEIRITHIPRAVQKLLEDDYITEFKTHFRGQLRKRKAYFLTEMGTEKAIALKESVGSQIVSLKTNDGRTVEKKMLDMYELFGSSLNFFEFYKLSTKHSVLDEAMLEEYKSTIVDKDGEESGFFKDFRHNIPEHAEILGREPELTTIVEWFDSEEQRVLLISGDRGIGKSALAAEAVIQHQRDFNIFWLKFQSGGSWNSLPHHLAELCAMNNYMKLDKYVKNNNNIVPSKAFKILSEELGDVNLLVVMDDIDYIKTGISELSGWLLPLLKFLPPWKVMITSSEPLPVELRSTSELESKYIEIQLKGLDLETSRKLLNADISDSEFESVYNYTEGNPLYLKAIREMNEEGKLDLKNFRPEELSLLKFLKIHEELK